MFVFMLGLEDEIQEQLPRMEHKKHKYGEMGPKYWNFCKEKYVLTYTIKYS